MTGGPNYELFQAAKRVLRQVPELSDVQVVAACGLSERALAWGDGPGTPLDVVRQARRDLEAGDLA